LQIAEEMAARLIDAQGGARNKKEFRNAGKLHRGELNRFKLLVEMLEKDLEDFQLGDPQNYKQHYNPLVPYFKLIMGVVSIILSAAWLIHIIIYMLVSPPVYPFLNSYLSFFDEFFPLFGTLTIAIFGLYLLLAASKGAAKFGTRFFLISVHNLEPHKTLLNSFMFNVQLVLLCVLPVVQFCTDAFSQYARHTDADVIFGTQMKYIYGFRYFWQYNVFLFTILGFFILAAIYFACFPSDRKHLNEVMNKIKMQKKKEMGEFGFRLNQAGGSLARM
jgi:LMBR1 domain-containing protein 1